MLPKVSKGARLFMCHDRCWLNLAATCSCQYLLNYFGLSIRIVLCVPPGSRCQFALCLFVEQSIGARSIVLFKGCRSPTVAAMIWSSVIGVFALGESVDLSSSIYTLLESPQSGLRR